MERKFTVAVVGSRSFDDYALLSRTLERVKTRPFRIVSGGAKGADALAEDYAKIRGVEIEVIRPDWDAHGRKAGFVRNREVVGRADAMIAFWDGESAGTKMVIRLAEEAGIPVHVVRFTI